jgi:SAM-dependent methyltransferase
MKDSFEKQQRYYELGKSYFWLAAHYDSIMKFANPLLNAKKQQGKIRILDAGCGCGNLINRLVQWGEIVGLDASVDALTFCQKKCAIKVIQASLEKMPFGNDTFDFIFAIQIIEHIKDDVTVMKELYNILKPNGFLIITVPAFMFLWGYHDEKYGHFRRYTKSDFRRILTETGGFIVEKSRYLNFFLALPLYLTRLFKRITHRKADDFYHVSNVFNPLLRRLINIDNLIGSIIDLPLGTFLILVLRKDERHNPK